MSSLAQAPASSRPAASRVWGKVLLAGLVGAVLASAANLGVRSLAHAAFDIPPEFLPLQVGGPVFFTVLGAFGAAIVYGLTWTFAKDPRRVFVRVAIVALALSMIPDLLLFRASPETFPGVTVPGVLALMAMHAVAAPIIVGAQLKWGPAR